MEYSEQKPDDILLTPGLQFRGGSHSLPQLGQDCKTLKHFIEAAIDPAVLRFDADSHGTLLYNQHLPSVTVFSMLNSLCKRASYEPFEAEVIQVILNAATPRIRNLLHPSKRRNLLPPPESHDVLPQVDPRVYHGERQPMEVEAGQGPLGGHVVGPSFGNRYNPLTYQVPRPLEQQLHGTERMPAEPLKRHGQKLKTTTVLSNGPQPEKPRKSKASRGVRLPWYMITDK